MTAAQPSLAGKIDGAVVQGFQPSSPAVVEDLAASARHALSQSGNPNASLQIGVGWYTHGSGAISESARAGLLSSTASRLARSNCDIDGVFADAWTMSESSTSNPWDWLGIADYADGALKASGAAYSQTAGTFLGLEPGEAQRRIIHTCGSSDPDRDGDGVIDPQDDAPLDPKRSKVGPQTRIEAGPSGATRSAHPHFVFSASDPGSTFQCRLGSTHWKRCGRHKTYRHVANGRHTLTVRAVSPNGKLDPTPARRMFRVDFKPPKVEIRGPHGHGSSARFVIKTHDQSRVRSTKCRIDRRAWHSCKRHLKLRSLSPGRHVLRVKAKDALGNTKTAHTRWRVKPRR
jgi:hypothetical protein